MIIVCPAISIKTNCRLLRRIIVACKYCKKVYTWGDLGQKSHLFIQVEEDME